MQDHQARLQRRGRDDQAGYGDAVLATFRELVLKAIALAITSGVMGAESRLRRS